MFAIFPIKNEVEGEIRMKWKKISGKHNEDAVYESGIYRLVKTIDDSGAQRAEQWSVMRGGICIAVMPTMIKADEFCRGDILNILKEEFSEKMGKKEFVTDSDLEDFCLGIEEIYGSDIRISPWKWLAEWMAANTPCEGCRYIQTLSGQYPCSVCIRNRRYSDCYDAQ